MILEQSLVCKQIKYKLAQQLDHSDYNYEI